MSDYICPRCGAKLSRAKTADGNHVYLICLTMNCTYSGTVPEYNARGIIEHLRAEVARLTAERDALKATVEKWLSASCTWCGYTEPYTAATADAVIEALNKHALTCRVDPRNIERDALAAELAEARDGIADLWNLCEILPHNQDCDISGTGYCDCNRGIFNSTIQNIMDANHMGEG